MTPNETVSTGGEETAGLENLALVPVADTGADQISLNDSAEATTSAAPSSIPTATSDSDTAVITPAVPVKKKRVRPRILKTQQYGIYTIDHVESANFFEEWYKGLRTSAPYIYKLLYTFWSLSPTRASLLIVANIFKAVLPSLDLWVSKGFLDLVQQAANGSSVRPRKLAGLAVLSLGLEALEQGLEILTYHLSSTVIILGIRWMSSWRGDFRVFWNLNFLRLI
jgi:hypothetical protein